MKTLRQREIKFRGIAVDNSDSTKPTGIWVYGHYRHLERGLESSDSHRIFFYVNGEWLMLVEGYSIEEAEYKGA